MSTGTAPTVLGAAARRPIARGLQAAAGRYPPSGEPGRARARAHRLNGVAEVVDVAQRVRAAVVPHQAEQVRRQRLGHLAWHREVLVLLLAQPGHVVGDVQADAGAGGAVGAPAVVHAARVEQHRAARHLRRLGVVGTERELVLAEVAPRHDPGGAVLLGEVGQCPDRVALHLVARWERGRSRTPTGRGGWAARSPPGRWRWPASGAAGCSWRVPGRCVPSPARAGA